ncbi:MAG: aromatic ring-hydroxylating dioxygenase subunit alpha [Alphaproteobacteria bacterium]|nr:aromatic ring-hydroxylating dioxygenase subunit alpha [Alphaproteobacteria bacterium]
MELVQNAWYVLLDPDEVPARAPVAVRRLGLDLVCWRDGAGRVAVAVDRCPHRWAKLSPGRVIDGCIECPFHGFRFDGGGACTAIPAHPDRKISGAMHLPVLPSRVAHGFVWVWTGPDPAPDADPPFFDFGGFSCAGSQLVVPVSAHYTRAVENQLDWPHLPFVHRTTIGRTVPPAMDVETRVDGDRIDSWLVSDPDGARIEFHGPCTWRLRTGPVWQFLAFVPIDDQRMQYYARTYQPFVRVPGVDWLVGRASAFGNRFVLDQDTPLVESQPPGPTNARTGEVLVPSDGPIIAYRKWRDARKAELAPA